MNGRVSFSPTVHGIQLFLWPYGQGKNSSAFFFSKTFDPSPIEGIPLIFGSEFTMPYDVSDDDLKKLFGFSYVDEYKKYCTLVTLDK